MPEKHEHGKKQDEQKHKGGKPYPASTPKEPTVPPVKKNPPPDPDDGGDNPTED